MLEQAIAALGTPVSARLLTDDALLDQIADVEELGRLVDAHRVLLASEVAYRSRRELGPEGLAIRSGRRNAAQLLEDELRVSSKEAKRRIRIGGAVAPRESLTGDALPPLHPAIAEAVTAGELGTDSAELILTALDSTGDRAHPTELAAAEQTLVNLAGDLPPTRLFKVAIHAVKHLDPDGAEPRDEEQRRRRSLTLGRAQTDGMAHLSVWATPELQATLRHQLFLTRRGRKFELEPDTATFEDTWVDTENGRTGPQADYDTFAALLTAGVRASETNDAASITGGPDTDITILATLEDIEARQANGQGWIDHIAVPIALPTVERRICSGKTRLVVIGPEGEVINFGRSRRLFSAKQKKALAIRDGGCAWPGCTAPVAWTDAHHVQWFERDDGPSDLKNGILLCNFHHHEIHRRHAELEIRMHEGVAYLVPAKWTGPPQPQHRMQRHPLTDERRTAA